jgi:AraC-like DNA-binding protein
MQCISVCSYNERHTPAAWDFPNITRPFSIIYYVLGGSAFYSADGVEVPLKRGHLYILPANKPFSLREDSADKFYSLYVHAYTSPEVDSLIDVDAKADPFIEHTLELMRCYARADDEIYMRKLCDMLLSYISERLGDALFSLAAKIKSYIDANYISVFKGNDLSHHFNYSRSHLTKIFKKKYSLTPKQYAQQLVIKEIIRLLYNGTSVNDIAETLDFSSPENLSRFFKGYYGCSPTEYRKRFKNFPL